MRLDEVAEAVKPARRPDLMLLALMLSAEAARVGVVPAQEKDAPNGRNAERFGK